MQPPFLRITGRAKRRRKNVKQPHARRLMAKLGNQAYKIIGDQLNPSLKIFLR